MYHVKFHINKDSVALCEHNSPLPQLESMESEKTQIQTEHRYAVIQGLLVNLMCDGFFSLLVSVQIN